MTDDGADMSAQYVSLAGYSFPANQAAFVCKHVVDGHAPVLNFFHEEDGDLQFVCGAKNHVGDDWALVCLSHIISWHADLSSLPTVDLGWAAWRDSEKSPWAVSPSE